MRHEDCTNWDYETHPNAKSVETACATLQAHLASGKTREGFWADTRPYHLQMFSEVTPSSCPYLAGNYRGALYPCLANYPIFFGAPPGRREGEKPNQVEAKMADYHGELKNMVDKHRDAVGKAKSDSERAVLFNRLIAATAALLTTFYDIHPYANGNGHIGRLLVLITLSAFGWTPKKLTLHKSPKGYYDLFDLYRANKKKPLEVFLLTSVVG